MSEPRRQTAYKCTVKQILESKYITQQGWEPNYLELGNLKVSRINLFAALVAKEGSNLVVDDGTGQLSLMLFQNQEIAINLKVGDILLIIGRPRVYNEQKYVVPEILKPIIDKRWVEYRKKELGSISFKNRINNDAKIKPIKKEYVKPVNINEKVEKIKITEKDDSKTLSQKIIDAIRTLDSGEGANIDSIIQEINIPKTEETIQNLINEGEIFEIRAGKVKVLD